MFRISGTVVSDLTGQPLAHAEVEIGLALKGETLVSQLTGEDGRFEFDHVPPAKYWLRAERNGFKRQGYEEHEGYFTGIVVGAGLQSENLIFKLRPDCAISGVVTDEQNEPIRDASVLLFGNRIENGRRAIVLVGQTNTNDRGGYRFSHQGSGTYFVAVSARPWYALNTRPRSLRRFRQRRGIEGPEAETASPNPALDVAYPLTYYSGATDDASATPIILKAGERASADVVLTAVHALTLRVHTPALAQERSFSAFLAQHVFEGRTVPVPQEETQTRKGEIDIGGLPPGEFSLEVQSYGGRDDGGKNSRLWAQSITLGSDMDITVPPVAASGSITGMLTLGGAPLGRRAYLQLRNASGNTVGAEVSPRGQFEISSADIIPGTYRVSVTNLPGAIVAGITATGAKVVGQSVTIAGNNPVRLTVTMSENLGSASGVALKDGKPWSGAMIVLVPQDPENTTLFRRDQSDSDGSFSLREVLPGKYTALAIENGWDLEWANASVLQAYLKGGEAVEIFPGRERAVKLKVQ